MRTTIQQLEDLKEWSKDSTRYERRLAFRNQSMPGGMGTEAGTIPVEFDELSDREVEYYRTGPWSTREDYQKGQLVQPGPGRQGYQGKDIKFGSGTDTSAMDNPKYYKTVRAELNKIKKMKNKTEFFDWKQGDAWYNNLKKRVGGMNDDHLNRLLKKVAAEEFPLAYVGKEGRQVFKRDTVVKSFLAHLENVGEFDGNEKTAKILEQFKVDHPDHKYQEINKAFREWKEGKFEVSGVDRSKLTKFDLTEINTWKPRKTQERSLIREKQLKYLHGLNDTLGNRDLKTIKTMFEKKFPDARPNAFQHRLDQLTQLKRTGKVISSLNNTKSYKWNTIGERSNWLKEGFGAQFQGNYTKLINEADRLRGIGGIQNLRDAGRLDKAADKFFDPSDGIFTKAGGQGEHPLSRLLGGPDQRLKINSLVRGDLNQWKRLNFDDPVMKLMNDYSKTKPGSPERKKIIQEIENRKKLMNTLTEGPNEKGIVESVQFRYGTKHISPSSKVVPIDQVKNFNVEDYVKRGKSYLSEFTRKGGTLLDESLTIKPKALSAKGVENLISKLGCFGKAAGGRAGFAEGTTCYTKGLEKIQKGQITAPGEKALFTKVAQTLGPDGWKFVGIDYAAATKMKGPVASILRKVAETSSRFSPTVGTTKVKLDPIKAISKGSKWLFGPVEMGLLPVALAGDALYQNYANKRDLKKALDQDKTVPQYMKNLLLEGYRQESRDIGGVGLESYAIDQPNISGALEKIGYGDRTELRQRAGMAIADVREQERQDYEQALRRAERERYDPNLPMMAGGGIAGLSGGKRFGPPPESGPDPQGLASMNNYATKRTG